MNKVVAALAAAALLAAAPLSSAQLTKAQKDVEDHVKILKLTPVAESRVKAIENLIEIALVKKSYLKPAIPALADALKDADVNVRRSAAQALSVMDPDPALVVPGLIKLLAEGEDRTVRIAAAATLGDLGQGGNAGTAELAKVQAKIAAMEEGQRDNDLLNTVNQALEQIKTSFLEAVQDHHEVLFTAADPKKRLQAVEELTRLSKLNAAAHQAALPSFVHGLMLQSDALVRKAIIEGAKTLKHDPAEVTKVLVAALAEDQDRGLRVAAATILSTLRGGAKDALPVLADIQNKENAKEEKDRDAELLTRVTQALEAIQRAVKAQEKDKPEKEEKQ